MKLSTTVVFFYWFLCKLFWLKTKSVKINYFILLILFYCNFLTIFYTCYSSILLVFFCYNFTKSAHKYETFIVTDLIWYCFIIFHEIYIKKPQMYHFSQTGWTCLTLLVVFGSELLKFIPVMNYLISILHLTIMITQQLTFKKLHLNYF